MLKRILFVCLFLIASCGTAPVTEGEQKNQATDPDDADHAKTEPVSVPVEKPNNETMYILEGEEIPACDLNGRLIYVQAEKSFKVCGAGAWSVVEIKGDKGDKGDAGESGTPGVDGQNGTDNKIVSQMICMTNFTGTVGIYRYLVFASGDVMVVGSVTGGYGQFSYTSMHAAGTVGATKGGVSVAMDTTGSNNFGNWTFELNSQKTSVNVVYTDSDVSGGADQFVMSEADCNTYTY